MKFTILFILVLTFASSFDRATLKASNNKGKHNTNTFNTSVSIGIWTARFEPVAVADSGLVRLIINGALELERPNAKAILSKARADGQIYLGVLVLNLSKRPGKRL